jgi:hypothetical protein
MYKINLVMLEIKYQILLIILTHWYADFILQTRKMGTLKSTSVKWLFIHVLVYSSVWFVIGLVLFNIQQTIEFTLITFLCHFATDFITSRISSFFYKKENLYGFFSTIGFDQFLHYLQLILTYSYITKLI